jgi:signal transduction histidine kinase
VEKADDLVIVAGGAPRVATVLLILTGLFLLGHVGLSAADGTLVEHGASDVVLIAAALVGGLSFSAAGWLIVTRQRRNTIGWLLMAIPVIFAVFAFAGDYATATLVRHPGSLPFGRAAAWIDRWGLVPMITFLIPLFLLFPGGALPSRRWRPVLWLAVAGTALTTVAFAVTPGRLTGSFADLQSVVVINPLGVRSLRGLIDSLTKIGGLACVVAAVLAGASIVVRFRRARGEERQQVKWMAFVGVVFLVLFALAATLGSVISEGPLADVAGNVLFTGMFVTLILGIPAACVVAVLKHHLYDLDVVVRKALVFASLAVFITAVYAAIVGVVGALVGTRSNTVASFVAAAVLAVGFAPARDRARRLADRLVFGRRATPYEVLTAFSSRVATTYADTDVLARMAEIVGTGIGASRARVWLRVGADLRTEASWPAGDGSATSLPMTGEALPPLPAGESAFEVRHDGELLGALTVAMSPADPMTPAKAKLVEDLTAQAGLVLRNVRLIEELRASRQRLVAAQDEERRKLERNIHDGAQQQLVALSIKLGLAEGLIGREPEKARELLAALRAESTDALEDLRDLARGIYPPLLADQGLAAALSAQARKSPIPVAVESDGIGRYTEEVEATVYFCALEAMQNVAKYSGATSATVRLGAPDGHLVFEVEDDGRGFDPAATGYGTGLQGMADRLDAIGGTLMVRSARGAGTTITGRLPV